MWRISKKQSKIKTNRIIENNHLYFSLGLLIRKYKRIPGKAKIQEQKSKNKIFNGLSQSFADT